MRVGKLTVLDSWELSGRVGIINSGDSEHSGSGSLDWKQEHDVLTFDFHGPLGAGAVHIQGDADALWVKTSRGNEFVTSDPEQDLTARLRMPVPVLSMRYWMLGIPDPHAAFDKQSDASGELTSLTQRGWRVLYQQYAEVRGYSLPVRITLQRDTVLIKIAVSDWTLPPAAP